MMHPLTVRSLLFDLGWGGASGGQAGPSVVTSCERDTCLGDDLDFEIAASAHGAISLEPDPLHR
jgi:hypothetical protein